MKDPMARTLSSHVLEEIRALPARYPQPRSAVMPALDLAQEELGHLTPEAMSEVAGALQLDPGYVEGVATFYTLFHLQPIGRHRFYVCTNLSCTLRGAEEIVEWLKGVIGVHEPGEVSKDGLFSYEEVECLGACEYAPVCRLDHRYQVDLTPEKIDQLVNARRSPQQQVGAAPSSSIDTPTTQPLPSRSPAAGALRKRAARPSKPARRSSQPPQESDG
jgi:NADH-quinone oxidoreductase subunit E